MSELRSSQEEGSHRVTLKDVARKLGVSHVSVSVALRDRGGVSPELKELIKKTAAEMGYVPEPMARALAVYRHNKRSVNVHSALAWVNFWPDPRALRSYPEFDLYWKGASEAALASGYHLEEFSLRDGATLGRLESILSARGIRGVMIPPHSNQIDWTGFDWRGFSVVRIGHSQVYPQSYVVAPDQIGNTLLAYEETRKAGYERIGYVGSFEKVTKWWFSGAFFMAQVHESASLRIPPLFLKNPTGAPDYLLHKSSLSQLESWIRKHKPQAIIGETGDLRTAAEKLGFRVPEDIAMANLSLHREAYIDTGINQNPILIGKAAADTLIALINRDERGETRHCHTVTVMGAWEQGKQLPVRR